MQWSVLLETTTFVLRTLSRTRVTRTKADSSNAVVSFLRFSFYPDPEPAPPNIPIGYDSLDVQCIRKRYSFSSLFCFVFFQGSTILSVAFLCWAAKQQRGLIAGVRAAQLVSRVVYVSFVKIHVTLTTFLFTGSRPRSISAISYRR